VHGFSGSGGGIEVDSIKERGRISRRAQAQASCGATGLPRARYLPLHDDGRVFERWLQARQIGRY
jgi:hypothetical protein